LASDVWRDRFRYVRLARIIAIPLVSDLRRSLHNPVLGFSSLCTLLNVHTVLVWLASHTLEARSWDVGDFAHALAMGAIAGGHGRVSIVF